MDWLLFGVLVVVGLTAAALVLILLPAPAVDTAAGDADEGVADPPRADGEGSDEGGGEGQPDALGTDRRAGPGDDR